MSRYVTLKENNNSKGYITTDIYGFKIKPGNNIKYDGVEVSTLIVTNNKLIENVLKRKTKRKINAYLNYLINIIDDDSDSGDVTLILDDIKKYRQLIINKYSKFLTKAYIEKILKRLKVLEKELSKKDLNNYLSNNFNKLR